MKTGLFSRLVDYEDPNSFGSKLRAKRSRYLIEVITRVVEKKGSCNILDVGGTIPYWNIFSHDWLRQHGVRVTLLNLRATVLPPHCVDIFSSVAGNACVMPEFADKSFDIVHSNSVIEHVGLWRNMEAMASEVRRIGEDYYVQTPNFWFPIEPHYFFPFIHWLPMPCRIALAMHLALGSWPRAKSVSEAVAAQQAAMLLNTKMLQSLFPDSRLARERFLGLTKSLIVLGRN